MIDTSPCTYGFRAARGYLTDDNQDRFDQMTFLDSVEFVHDTLPKLHINSQLETVVLHPVCSVTKLGLTPKLEAIAQACSDKVFIPFDAGCLLLRQSRLRDRHDPRHAARVPVLPLSAGARHALIPARVAGWLRLLTAIITCRSQPLHALRSRVAKVNQIRCCPTSVTSP